jgi:hypothetical protein
LGYINDQSKRISFDFRKAPRLEGREIQSHFQKAIEQKERKGSEAEQCTVE